MDVTAGDFEGPPLKRLSPSPVLQTWRCWQPVTYPAARRPGARSFVALRRPDRPRRVACANELSVTARRRQV